MHVSIKSALAAAAIAGGTLLLPLTASAADLAKGDYVGKTKAEITATLEKQGYKINDIDHERGKFEVEVEKKADTDAIDPADVELKIDEATGKIVKVEIED